MILRFPLPILLLVGTALTALATSQEIIQRHFDAAPNGKLIVDVGFGTVQVTGAGDNKTVGINARRIVEMTDKAREKEFVEAVPILISQENNVITVQARSDRSWTWHGDHNRMEAHYSVQIPKDFNLELHTGGGAIELADVNGEIHANTAGGNLTFGRIHGPTDAKTSGGDIKLTDCDGALKIQTSGGRIDSAGGKGSLDLHTAGGQVLVHDFAGGVNVQSGGGRVTLDNDAGPITARTGGGAIHATIAAATDTKLETNAGAIVVAIPASGGFDVDAHSGVGEVITDLPLTTARNNRDNLSGALNGGGKRLFLRSGAGTISIKAADGKPIVRH